MSLVVSPGAGPVFNDTASHTLSSNNTLHSAFPSRTTSVLRSAHMALVHDWLNQLGGAENVLEEMVSLFPQAPVYTSMYAPDLMPDSYRSWPIRTSFMQRLPGVTRWHQSFLPLYPMAFSRTDLSGYDLVLSNKSGFCHGVKTQTSVRNGHETIHVCYCLTPTRYLWFYDQYREREQIGGVLNAALQPLLSLLRRWDWQAAQGVDHFIAISSEIQQRIQTIYGRNSVVIHPPVDTDYFTPDGSTGGTVNHGDVGDGDYFLIVSRLIPYKRIDLVVEAFRHLPQERLLIVGEGRDQQDLITKAGDNVTFLGRRSRDEVRELMRGCKAFLFPGFEDFGIAPVEALSCGRPVVAFAGGGALDTVVPGVTGEFFEEQTVESLLQTLKRFDASTYSAAACREQADFFSQHNFRRKLLTYLEDVLEKRDPDAHPLDEYPAPKEYSEEYPTASFNGHRSANGVR